MGLRTVSALWAVTVFSLFTAPQSDAECVRLSAGAVLKAPWSELVFSGTVVEKVRTADVGLRATFEVDRVWKGSVPERFELYIWELAAEIPRFELGARHIVIAKRLTDERARMGAGLGNSTTVAFTPVQCSDPETLGPDFRRDLGRGEPPRRVAARMTDAAQYVDGQLRRGHG